jgi:hypothetical protein
MNEERKIVIASDSGISIRSFSDISDAVGACIGAEGLILRGRLETQHRRDTMVGLCIGM